MTNFELARPTHNKLLELLEMGVINEKYLLENLMSWLPEKDLKDFAKDYGYLDEEE